MNVWPKLNKSQLWRADWILLGSAILLVCFGLVALYSSTLTDAANFPLFRKQLLIAVLGIFLMLTFALSDYRAFKSYGKVLYTVVVVLLLALLVTGRAVHGSTAWLHLFGGAIQPVEFAKIGLLVLLARYFALHIGESGRWKPVLMSGILMAIAVLLVLLQPDLGSAIILIVIWLVLIFFFGLRLKQWLIIIGLGLAAAIFSWFFLLSGYQHARVLTFINPTGDPLGSGYNVTQSIVAVGSGQFLGRGLGLGSQSQLNFLPEQYTDFIFAAISEELGFLGSLAVLILLATVIIRLMIIAKRSEDDFGTLVCLGLAGWIGFQSFTNLGGALGVLPLTGVTLPLVSAGGSSMVSALIALGVAQSVALRGRHGFQ